VQPTAIEEVSSSIKADRVVLHRDLFEQDKRSEHKEPQIPIFWELECVHPPPTCTHIRLSPHHVVTCVCTYRSSYPRSQPLFRITPCTAVCTCEHTSGYGRKPAECAYASRHNPALDDTSHARGVNESRHSETVRREVCLERRALTPPFTCLPAARIPHTAFFEHTLVFPYANRQKSNVRLSKGSHGKWVNTGSEDPRSVLAEKKRHTAKPRGSSLPQSR
jgi:hypothetical protein